MAGPPGSGKSAVGAKVAKRYGLVFVSTGGVLQAEVARKTDIGRVIVECMDKGELVPDEIVVRLMQERLGQSDCKVCGWVLEGFPRSEGQIRMLKDAKQTPSLIVGLQIDDDVVYERHEYKKVDPMTGIAYDLKSPAAGEQPDGVVMGRLQARDCDKLEVVKRRLKAWKEFLPKLEEAYKEKRLSLSADKAAAALVDTVSEAIENPVS